METERKVMSKKNKVLHIGAYAIGFMAIIIALNEYANNPLSAKATLCFNIAVLIFLVLLWVIQKVKLFNLPSLIVSVAFGVYAFFFLKFVLTPAWSVIHHRVAVISIIEQWLLLMLIVDMVVTKRIRKGGVLRNWCFGLFLLTAVLLLVDNAGKIMPITLLLFALLALIPIEEDEWMVILDGVLVGGLLSFVVTTVFIFLGSPFSKETGFFAGNISDIGQYYGFSSALALTAVIRWGRKYDRIGFRNFTSFLWLIGSVVLSFVKGGHTNALGLLLLATMFVIIFPKDRKRSTTVIRTIITIIAVSVVCGIAFMFARTLFLRVFTAPYLDDLEMKKFLLNEILDSAYFGGSGSRDLGEKWTYLTTLHNHFAYLAYEYGFLDAGISIMVGLFTWGVSVIRCLKYRNDCYVFPALMGAMTIGVWMNHLSGLYYPLTFICVLSMLPTWTGIGCVKTEDSTVVEEKAPVSDTETD